MFKHFNYQHVLYGALISTVLSALYLKLNESAEEEVADYAIVAPTSRHIAHQAPPTLNKPKVMHNANTKLDQLLLSETNIFNTRKKIEPQNEVATATIPLPPKQMNIPTKPLVVNPVSQIEKPLTSPLPTFRYLGKLLGDDEYQVFLSYQDKNYVLKVGDTIQDIYKVEKIQPPVLALNNIASNIQQEINIGE